MLVYTLRSCTLPGVKPFQVLQKICRISRCRAFLWHPHFKWQYCQVVLREFHYANVTMKCMLSQGFYWINHLFVRRRCAIAKVPYSNCIPLEQGRMPQRTGFNRIHLFWSSYRDLATAILRVELFRQFYDTSKYVWYCMIIWYVYIYDVYVHICHSLRECHFSCNRLQSIQHGATCFLNHEPFVFSHRSFQQNGRNLQDKWWMMFCLSLSSIIRRSTYHNISHMPCGDKSGFVIKSIWQTFQQAFNWIYR